MTDPTAYRCPLAGCNRTALTAGEDGLACAGGHFFAYLAGTRVPVFARATEALGEYTRPNAVAVHDNALRWVCATFGIEEPDLRTRLASRVPAGRGRRLLVTGAGTGNDLPYLADRLEGAGEIYALDISPRMLLAAVERHHDAVARRGITLHFAIADALDLPFADGYFDAAYHFGGINLYDDIRRGIAEMARVVRPGGRVVFGDEGVAPWLRQTELGKMLVGNNPLYGCEVPLALLPAAAREVVVSWELANCFYVVAFTVAAAPPEVDIDVPHVGVRGGTIRTRYHGQLEGIDPELRDRVYAEAERRGVSRVAFLEAALRDKLAGR